MEETRPQDVPEGAVGPDAPNQPVVDPEEVEDDENEDEDENEDNETDAGA